MECSENLVEKQLLEGIKVCIRVEGDISESFAK